MKSTIRIGQHQSLSVDLNTEGKLTMIFSSDEKASTTASILRLTRDQAEALVFGIEAALESAMPLPAMGELAKV